MTDAPALLAEFERALDPARPNVEVLAYGEVSAVLAVPSLPTRVCKRMAGFRHAEAVARYVDVVRRYVELLEQFDIRVAETQLVPVELARRRPVVYVLQPRLDPRRFGHALLREADDTTLASCVDRVLACVLRVARGNHGRADGVELAVDAQLSNWHFPGEGMEVGQPLLVDVGTPYLRRGGRYEIDLELFLAAAPPLIRGWYRRAGAVERYLDDYFTPRLAVLDLLGNFHKEGRPERVPSVLPRVNAWLAANGGDLADVRPIEAADVDRYYARDAAQLELYLRLRRLYRALTRLAGRRYDFVLPGAIRR
jgi:uncharacterized protein DUF6206